MTVKVEIRERLCVILVGAFMIPQRFTNFNKKLKGGEICMLAQWMGEIVGQMHNNKISQSQLADRLGIRREYVSVILNGHRCPAGAEARFRAAVNELIAEKKAQN
jgi:hypothetical protein